MEVVAEDFTAVAAVVEEDNTDKNYAMIVTHEI
jgi:hypothetical protein